MQSLVIHEMLKNYHFSVSNSIGSLFKILFKFLCCDVICLIKAANIYICWDVKLCVAHWDRMLNK